jgi:hypothetical protein
LFYRWVEPYRSELIRQRRGLYTSEELEEWTEVHASEIDEALKVKYLCYECNRQLIVEKSIPGYGHLCYDRTAGCLAKGEDPLSLDVQRCFCLILSSSSGIKMKSSGGVLGKRVERILSQEDIPVVKKTCSHEEKQ